MELTELIEQVALLADMDDETLATYVADIQAAAAEAGANVPSAAADKLALVGLLAQAAEAVDAATALQTTRSEELAAADAELEAALARLAPAPEVEETPEEETPELAAEESEDELEAMDTVAAAALGKKIAEGVAAGIDAAKPIVPAIPKAAMAAPRVPAAHRPAPRSETPMLRVKVGAERVESNDPTRVMASIVDGFMRTDKAAGRNSGATPQSFSVATFTNDYDDAYKFEDGTSVDLTTKVRELVAREDQDRASRGNSLTASGGVCGPQTPYYEQVLLATARRPVVAALTPLNVTRGGITYTPSATLATIKANVANAAITTHTDADDVSGSLKTVQTIVCGTAQTVKVNSIVSQLKFGNLFARTSPEQMANAVSLTAAKHAQVADQKLLSLIDANSTAVGQTSNTSGVLGASRDILFDVGAAVAGYRMRHRADPNLRLNAIFPEWILPMMKGDLVRALQADRAWFEVSDADILRWFSSLGVDAFFTPDESMTGAQGIGGLVDYPDTCKWRLFHKGMFLFLDQGSLDLGVVRDSTLNSTNDFETFSESFEGLAPVGLESLVVTTDVCANGQSSATRDLGTAFCATHASVAGS